jgi:hypothetical protein
VKDKSVLFLRKIKETRSVVNALAGLKGTIIEQEGPQRGPQNIFPIGAVNLFPGCKTV